MSGASWLAGLLFAYGGLIAGAPDGGGSGPADGESNLDCAHCHECDHPTASQPCLKEFDCPRHLRSAGLKPELGPDVSILDQLEDLYVPVYFNHRTHAGMAAMEGGCALCHHFTPPDSPHPACRECHPVGASREDLDQPGLKGAYHRQCFGCHQEWDGETKCEICHAKKAGGALHGDATTFCTEVQHQKIAMKDLIIFETGYEDGDRVPFHHKNHVEKYEGECRYCHQQADCSACHTHGEQSHPIGELDDIDLHDTCYVCHESEDGDDCTECHGRDPNDLFRHADTGWGLKIYHAYVKCSSCHDRRGSRLRKPASHECTSCHADGWDPEKFRHDVTRVMLDETHRDADCADCHAGGIGVAPASCDECHDDGRAYSAETGFGAGDFGAGDFGAGD